MSKRETDEKKEYLNRRSEALAAVERIENELKEIQKNEQYYRKDASNIQVSEKNKKDLSDYLIKKEEVICERYQVQKRYMEEYHKVLRAIEALPKERERNIITLKYVQQQTWKNIMFKMDMGWAQVHRLHNEALEHFVIPEE